MRIENWIAWCERLHNKACDAHLADQLRTAYNNGLRDAANSTPATTATGFRHATEDYYQRRIAELEAAAQRVRELHRPHCAQCAVEEADAFCACCIEAWPCETIRALNGEAQQTIVERDEAYAHGVNDERKAAAERVRAALDALVDDESPRFGCGCASCTAERTALIDAAGGAQ